MAQLTESVANLIDQLAKLPGIGRKSAERLAYHLLRVNQAEAMELSDAIRHVRENVRYCSICFNLAETRIVQRLLGPQAGPDATVRGRAASRPDVAGSFGHVSRACTTCLLGRIAPLDGVGPDQLTLEALVERVRTGQFKEIIMATNPTVEGDGTALHISNFWRSFPSRSLGWRVASQPAAFSNSRTRRSWPMP